LFLGALITRRIKISLPLLPHNFFLIKFVLTTKPKIIVNRQKEFSDPELILLWQDGHEYAFDLIHRRYSVKLLGIAMQKTGDEDAAKEIVQDVFVTLFKNKASCDKISSLFAYLYVILKNRVLDWHRHNLVHNKYVAYATSTAIEADFSTQHWIETRELEQQLNAEIEKLPPQCRTVFKLSRQEHFTNREIAAHLEISENTVEQHMRKALRILRTSLIHYRKMIILFILNVVYWNL